MRSSHCGVTGRCIARLDHYCAWTGCVIGWGNHRVFIIFVAAMALHLLVGAGTCVYVLHVRLHAHTHGKAVLLGSGSAPAYVAAAIATMCGIFAAYTCALLVAQLCNAATDTTVRERLRHLAGGGNHAAGKEEAAGRWARDWPRQSRKWVDNCIRFWWTGM
jgi:palmitoyltransferase